MALENKQLQQNEHPSSIALLIIDMINDMEFDEGDKLVRFATPAAHRIHEIKKRFVQSGWPVIYANDNFGQWKSDFQSTVDYCLQPDRRGHEVAELLKPSGDDYFVLKPKHSAFYLTPLDLLLQHLQVSRLVITGVATDICVQFTCNDAYMRDYELIVPGDCVAANSSQRTDHALESMRAIHKADTRASQEVDWRNVQ